MKTHQSRAIGVVLVTLGVLIVGFSEKVVFPGLELLLGIETIVGRDSVLYLPDGGYMFTNPAAMVRWILGVVVVGIASVGFGCWLLFKEQRSQGNS